METNEAGLLMLRGLISQLAEEQQKTVEENAQKIRDIIASDEVAGPLALALVGFENAVD